MQPPVGMVEALAAVQDVGVLMTRYRCVCVCGWVGGWGVEGESVSCVGMGCST